MKKIYQLQADLENYDIGFYVEQECSIENSHFSKKEIKEYLENHALFKDKVEEYLKGELSFTFVEIEMRHRKNVSLKSLIPFIKLITDGEKLEIIDIMRVSGFFRNTLLLSLKAKEYIEKRYGEKKIEFLEIFYKEIPLYIMNVMEMEYCTEIDFPRIRRREVLDITKIGKEEIFRAKSSKNLEFIDIGIFCTEEFKKYIEASDLKGYEFVEVLDVAEARKLKEEEEKTEEPVFPEIEEKRYYENGNIEWEGTLWQGFRIKSWKFYYENGVLSMEGEYNSNGEATGEWKYYYLNGTLKAVGKYIEGKKTGIFQNYHEEKGYLLSQADYTGKEKKDLIPWKFYYEDGSLQKEGTAREIGNNEDWEITGEWRYYSPTGELLETAIFEKNELIRTDSN